MFGNTVSRLKLEGEDMRASMQLCLEALIPQAQPPALSRHSLLSLYSFQAACPKYFDPPKLVEASNPILSAPLSQGTAHSAKPTPKRTGRTTRHRSPQGTTFYYVKSKHGSGHRIRRINRIRNLTNSPAPPPRGTPGAPVANEECAPTGDAAKTQSRGAIRRRYRRRAYRQWRKLCNKARVSGAGSRNTPALPLKKATYTTAKWFRQSMLWQQAIKRQKKRKVTDNPTIPPLSYDSKFRFGALNVQGFADTLKLKNTLLIMEEHRLDVMILTETKSTSYYSYQSEGYLVILSGNNRDKHAGVGAILAPRVRPHLLDIIQVSNRLIHLSFKKQGGNFHILGAYAPHSGRDFDQDRQPFWGILEDHVSKIPHLSLCISRGISTSGFKLPTKMIREC